MDERGVAREQLTEALRVSGATRRGEQVLQAARARRVAALASSLESLAERDRRTLERAADLLERLA